MTRTKTILSLFAVGALAFTIGSTGIFTSATAIASPQDHKHSHDDHAPSHFDQMDADLTKMMAAGTPGEHHKLLNSLEGKWEGEFSIWMERGGEAMTTAGTIEREWILDGRFMKEDVEATSDMGTFRGLGYIGYNNLDGQYEMVWMENMATAITMATGTYNSESKTLTTHGTYRDPISGNLVQVRSQVDMSYDNRHVFKSWATGSDGVEFLTFKGVAERVQ